MVARGSRWTLAIALLLVVAMVDDSLAAGPQAKRKKRRHPPASVTAAMKARRAQDIQSVESQVTAARKQLAAAEARAAAANATLGAANQRVSQAREEIDTARKDIREGRTELRSIEADLIEAADDSSALQRAVSEVEQARANLQRAEIRVLESKEYQARVAALGDTEQGAKKLGELRSDALQHDAGYQDALFAWEIASEHFNGLRGTEIYADPQWKQTSESLRDAKLSHNRAVQQAGAGGMQKLPAGAQLRRAQSAANEARQVITAGEAWLQKSGVRPTTRSAGDKKK